MIAHEILTTEKEYCKTLSVIQNIFRKPLEASVKSNRYVTCRVMGLLSSIINLHLPITTALSIPHRPLLSYINPCYPTSTLIIPYQPSLSHINPRYPTLTFVIPHQPLLSHINPRYPTSTLVIPYQPSLSPINPRYPTSTLVIPH